MRVNESVKFLPKLWVLNIYICTVVIQLSGRCGTGESEKCPDNQKIRIIENIIKHPLAL